LPSLARELAALGIPSGAQRCHGITGTIVHATPTGQCGVPLRPRVPPTRDPIVRSTRTRRCCSWHADGHLAPHRRRRGRSARSSY
jgi:hypothetical protein